MKLDYKRIHVSVAPITGGLGGFNWKPEVESGLCLKAVHRSLKSNVVEIPWISSGDCGALFLHRCIWFSNCREILQSWLWNDLPYNTVTQLNFINCDSNTHVLCSLVGVISSAHPPGSGYETKDTQKPIQYRFYFHYDFNNKHEFPLNILPSHPSRSLWSLSHRLLLRLW